MFNKIFSRKGEALTITAGFIVASVIIAGLTGTALYKTSKNGVLRNNGKIIWCKMQNKGNDFCDALYLPFPDES